MLILIMDDLRGSFEQDLKMEEIKRANSQDLV